MAKNNYLVNTILETDLDDLLHFVQELKPKSIEGQLMRYCIRNKRRGWVFVPSRVT